MWSANSNGLRGEANFASFNFQANKPYSIKIRYRTTMASGTGQINIFAANNMVEAPLDTIVCGGGVPTVSSKEQIAQITEGNKDWTIATIGYIPTANYSQVWLYPYNTSITQFNLYVDYISVCLDSCGATVNYTNTNLPSGQLPTGTNRAGVFNISGNSLSVLADQNTTLIAAQQILIQPTFNAVVTSGEFIAKIEPCDSSAISSRQADFQDRQNVDVSQFPTEGTFGASIQKRETSNSLMVNENQPRMKLYPNPSQTVLNIDLSENNGEVDRISLMNSSGLQIKVYKPVATKVQLDIRTLSKGTYFIQIIEADGKITTTKFIKL
jgi:hypothetical protein